jgi:hypothetical protein
MLMTITSSSTFMGSFVRSFIVRPLPLCTAVHTLFLFMMSYAVWLMSHPALPLDCSYRNTTSVFHSTPNFSAAMAHTYDLAQLYMIALNIEGSCTSSVSRFNAGLCNPPSSHCHYYWHCCCRWRRALHHCYIFRLHSSFHSIAHLLFAPAPVSSFWCCHPQD